MEVSTSVLSIKEEESIQKFYDLEVAKTDYFHIDVMDGRFVTNDTSIIMRKYAEYLSQITLTPLDVHLMVKNIKEYVDSYSIFNPNIISFHYEACENKEKVEEYIKYIKDKEIKVGLAINPITEIKEIEEFLPKINMLLIMSVEPGKGGQTFIEEALEKVEKANKKIEELDLSTEIEVDGGINLENIEKIEEKGATIAVSGTGILSSKDYKYTIREMKK